MATAIAVSTALAIPADAAAQGPQPAQLGVQVQALHGGKRPAIRRTTAVGTLSPFLPGQRVQIGRAHV